MLKKNKTIFQSNIKLLQGGSLEEYNEYLRNKLLEREKQIYNLT